MKWTSLAFTVLIALSSPAFADGKGAKKECTCDHACQEKCTKGEGKDCKCAACDCAKSGQCEHGKCEHHDHDKKKKS